MDEFLIQLNLLQYINIHFKEVIKKMSLGGSSKEIFTSYSFGEKTYLKPEDVILSCSLISNSVLHSEDGQIEMDIDIWFEDKMWNLYVCFGLRGDYGMHEEFDEEVKYVDLLSIENFLKRNMDVYADKFYSYLLQKNS